MLLDMLPIIGLPEISQSQRTITFLPVSAKPFMLSQIWLVPPPVKQTFWILWTSYKTNSNNRLPHYANELPLKTSMACNSLTAHPIQNPIEFLGPLGSPESESPLSNGHQTSISNRFLRQSIIHDDSIIWELRNLENPLPERMENA